MKVDLVQSTPPGIHWNHCEIGKAYQSVANPDIVVIPFWYVPDNSRNDVKLAMPVHTGNQGHPFRAYYPVESSRWVEVEATVKVFGKV